MSNDQSQKLLVVVLSAFFVGCLAASSYGASKKSPPPTRKASPKKLKLIYFDLAGKGECIRLACAYANVDLEDKRITPDQFQTMKSSGELKFGQVPALVVDDKDTLIQSASIMRYVGKVTGLYPEDNLAAALVDAIVDQENDMFAGLTCSRYRDRFGFGCLDDETVAKVRKSLNDEVLPRHLSYLERLLRESSTPFIANTPEPSIADFILVPRLQWLESGANDGISKAILSKYPDIKNYMQTFLSLPKIKEFYSKK